MAFLENFLRSDFVILLAVIFCLYNVVLATWGLGMMTNDCKNRTLFTNLRICLVSSAVMATMLICLGTCNVACNTDLHEGFLAVCMFVWSIMNLASGVYIASNIAECASNDVSIYKNCWYVAYVVEVAVMVSCIYYAFMRYTKRKVAKAGERKRTEAKQSEILEKQLEEEKKALKLEAEAVQERERAKAKREELERVREERARTKQPEKKDSNTERIEKLRRAGRAKKIDANRGLLQSAINSANEELKEVTEGGDRELVLREKLARLTSLNKTENLEKDPTEFRRLVENKQTRRLDPWGRRGLFGDEE